METNKEIILSNKFEADGIKFIEPSFTYLVLTIHLEHVKIVMDLERQ